MIRIAAIAVIAALTAGAARAQTYVPGQAQANLNQYQAQVQADQLQQLQRQNTQGLQQPDPGAQALAIARQQQIQQQVDANIALQQQLLSPQGQPGGRQRPSAAERRGDPATAAAADFDSRAGSLTVPRRGILCATASLFERAPR